MDQRQTNICTRLLVPWTLKKEGSAIRQVLGMLSLTTKSIFLTIGSLRCIWSQKWEAACWYRFLTSLKVDGACVGRKLHNAVDLPKTEAMFPACQLLNPCGSGDGIDGAREVSVFALALSWHRAITCVVLSLAGQISWRCGELWSGTRVMRMRQATGDGTGCMPTNMHIFHSLEIFFIKYVTSKSSLIQTCSNFYI